MRPSISPNLPQIHTPSRPFYVCLFTSSVHFPSVNTFSSLVSLIMTKKNPQAANAIVVEAPEENSQWSITGLLDPRDNVRSTITEERLEEIKASLNRSIEAVVPTSFERADWHRENWVCLYFYPLDIRMPFPYSELVKDVLSEMRVSPGQLMPYAWRTLACLESIEAKHKLGINADVVKSCYTLKKFFGCRFSFCNKNKEDPLIYNCDSVHDRKWKSEYWFAEKSSLGEECSYFQDRWSSVGK